MPGDFFHLRQVRGVRVMELTLANGLESEEFDRLNEQLLAALDAAPSACWVIDVSAVNYMGSSVLGLFVNLRQHLKTTKGQLALCGLSPRLREIFEASSLVRLFTIRKTAVEAVAVFDKR